MGNGGRRPFRHRYRERLGRIGLLHIPIRREVLDREPLNQWPLARNGAGTQVGHTGT
jgi:hypothetical protein